MKTVLIATEKPFSKAATASITAILEEKGHKVKLLEKYTDVNQLYKAVADVNAIIVRSDKITPEVVSHAPNLEMVVRAGAGYDNVDLVVTKGKGIVVENTPGQNSNAVAELAFGLMVMAARNFYDGSTGFELKGKKFGIHGFGYIGKCSATIANGFGMEIFYHHSRLLPIEVTGPYNAIGIEDVVDFYRTCQFISLNIPMRPANAKIINYDLMMSMPENAVLVNTARAEVVNDEDLLRVFEDRKDFRYAADVVPSNKAEIAEKFAGRVFFTPKKLGAQTAEANNNAGMAAANQINEYFATGVSQFQVNK